jgi:hypothetical protein
VKKYEAVFSNNISMAFLAEDANDAKRVVDYWAKDNKERVKNVSLFLLGETIPFATRNYDKPWLDT